VGGVIVVIVLSVIIVCKLRRKNAYKRALNQDIEMDSVPSQHHYTRKRQEEDHPPSYEHAVGAHS
jgi:hypothetical protein